VLLLRILRGQLDGPTLPPWTRRADVASALLGRDFGPSQGYTPSCRRRRRSGRGATRSRGFLRPGGGDGHRVTSTCRCPRSHGSDDGILLRRNGPRRGGLGVPPGRRRVTGELSGQRNPLLVEHDAGRSPSHRPGFRSPREPRPLPVTSGSMVGPVGGRRPWSCVRVVIADDALIVRFRSRRAARHCRRGGSRGARRTLTSCWPMVELRRPDAVVVDVRMPRDPDRRGNRRRRSDTAGTIRTSVCSLLSQAAETSYAVALARGEPERGLGYLLKERVRRRIRAGGLATPRLRGGVRRRSVGDLPAAGAVRARAIPWARSTEREREVLIGDGRRPVEIAG
jgi:DNA-binding NarL/FixJ family response regulator